MAMFLNRNCSKTAKQVGYVTKDRKTTT